MPVTSDNSTKATDKQEDSRLFSKTDIKHNMIVLVMLDAIFTMGAADLQIATGPLWKFLHASNTVIGLAGSLAMLGVIGAFFSPFISLKFSIKKWYLLLAHLPYLGAWLLIGLALVFSRQLGLSNPTLLTVVVALTAANFFFGGFVTLPHQEYTAACIPMSHRGRFTGYSQGIGSAAALISSVIGGVILARISKPMAFGYLFLMTWFICQSGYLLALLGREKPTPVEKAPRAWSKDMLIAAWRDKPFLRVILLYMLYTIVFMPVFTTYLGQYGFREIKMADATAATMAIVMQIVRIILGGPIGHFTDKFSPKRALICLPILGCISILPALLLHNQIGVYIATGLSGVYLVAHYAAFWALLYGLPSPENRAGHYTVQILMGYIAMAIGPILIGYLCDKVSYSVTFVIVAVIAFGLSGFAKVMLKGVSTEAKEFS